MARSGTDRRVTALSIALALAFAALALASLALPPWVGLGSWLPLHLLLAGGAASAIAGVMPFFSAALASTAPAPLSLRLGAVIGVAAGAAVLTAGRLTSSALTGPGATLTGVGGLIYMGGLGLVGSATLLPLRRALGQRRLIVGAIYGVAILDVLAGAVLAVMLLFNIWGAAASWPALKPAHAWLNLFGFVSLTIAGSLLHLLPTVVGARIARTRAATSAYACMVTGPPLVAAGFIAASTALALAGALVVLGAAVSLGLFAAATLRRRAAWTTDAGWHLLTSWSLVAGVGWFIVSSALGTLSIWAGGATADGWKLSPLIVPLGVGWVGQVLLGAASHLIPAVGPGSPERHAHQRRTLGTASMARLLTLNAGVAAATLGLAADDAALTLVGMAAVVVGGVAALALAAAALLAPDSRAARLAP